MEAACSREISRCAFDLLGTVCGHRRMTAFATVDGRRITAFLAALEVRCSYLGVDAPRITQCALCHPDRRPGLCNITGQSILPGTERRERLRPLTDLPVDGNCLSPGDSSTPPDSVNILPLV